MKLECLRQKSGEDMNLNTRTQLDRWKDGGVRSGEQSQYDESSLPNEMGLLSA